MVQIFDKGNINKIDVFCNSLKFSLSNVSKLQFHQYRIMGNSHKRKHSQFSHFADHLQTFSSRCVSFHIKIY